MKILKINSLEKGFCDRDSLLLHAAFQIFVDFVEKEEPEKIIDWSYNSKHRKTWKEISLLYKWWTKTRPIRKWPLDKKGLKMPPICLENGPDSTCSKTISYDEKKYEKYKNAMKKAISLDKKWAKEDQGNLYRLIAIRDFLWT